MEQILWPPVINAKSQAGKHKLFEFHSKDSVMIMQT